MLNDEGQRQRFGRAGELAQRVIGWHAAPKELCYFRCWNRVSVSCLVLLGSVVGQFSALAL